LEDGDRMRSEGKNQKKLGIRENELKGEDRIWIL